MKFLLLILLLALVFFMLGVKRARPPEVKKPPAPPAELPPQDMVSCAQCGLHLPQGEALPGRGGVFCSAAHRQAFEAASP
jgi:uncharacterized protein